MKKEEMKLSDILVESTMVSSKNEARRFIEQGGVKIDSQKTEEDFVVKFEKEFVLQIGKRKFRRVVFRR
ncbi:MAG: hypothetical protein LE180_03910 [Endomicrobium sp.]|nr:hypothetical protein [Endomicrobium sp.]